MEHTVPEFETGLVPNEMLKYIDFTTFKKHLFVYAKVMKSMLKYGLYFFLVCVGPETWAATTGPTPIEKALGPWLDLDGGGIAVGPASSIQQRNPDGTVSEISGRLVNGTLLPEDGDSFHRFGDISMSWGTGMMISLLENASAYYKKNFVPTNIVYVNAIAQEHGGPYGPHKSHENGLDADVFYMGQTKWESVLDAQGQVTSKFNPQKNWDFWRLLFQQQILVKGKPTTVVYMIFVAPQIKDFLCAWADKQNLASDPLNADILRRLRPTTGHDTHFHLRLKCSPYYKDCIQQSEPAEGTGCNSTSSRAS